MSAFKIALTPPGVTNLKKRNEAREPTLVVLAPFTPKSIVTFHEIPVTKTARRYLQINNPTNDDMKILLTKILKPEYNAKFEWTSNIIPAASDISMEIEWTPMKEFSGLETIQFTDNRGFKKDVTVVLKSVIIRNMGRKIASKKPLTQSNARVTKLKSPSPAKVIVPQRSSPARGVRRRSYSSNSVQVRKLQQNKCLETTSNQQIENGLETRKFEFDDDNESNDKENASPDSSNNVSALFTAIKFTPASETKKWTSSKLDYMYSLPTPTSDIRHNAIPKFSSIDSPRTSKLYVSSHTDFNRRKSDETHLLLTPKVKTRQAIMDNYTTPHVKTVKDFHPEICSTINRRKINIDTLNSEEEHCVSNKTFELESTFNIVKIHEYEERLETYQSEVIEVTTVEKIVSEPLNVTHSVVSTQLSMVQEDDSKSASMKIFEGATFDLSEAFQTTEKYANISAEFLKSPERNTKAETTEFLPTPLRKIISFHNLNQEVKDKNIILKYNQGSMPNLNDDLNTFMNTIENNRYFKKTPTRSYSTNTVFEETEIRAQSSRHNLNELHSRQDCKENIRLNYSGLLNEPDDEIVIQKRKRFFPNEIVMTITPPKTKRILKPEQSNNNGQNIRTTNWNSKQPIKAIHRGMPTLTLKKKSTSSLSIASKPMVATNLTPSKCGSAPTTPKKRRNYYNDGEERVALFSQEYYLQGIINPDPFAATTTCDPFLATTMYLDQQSVDRHEAQFKKWLNALVTVPEEMESNQRLDIGKLFQDVKNKQVTVPATKEKVSSKYFTKFRMISLRKIAFDLFRSDMIRVPLSKVVTLIEKRQISIRSDRNLHLDVVLQRNILELLLSFNPLWLRIGLEVVFNEEIPLNSNTDVYGLSTFILNRLFRDKYLEAKYTKSYMYSETYTEQIKIFALKQILMLLLFLDKAKEMKIIKHNPCLFVKNSQYKETREILCFFSSSLIANTGDITKYLRRLGYTLTHKQTYIDEFDYAFQNLAVDLRDGIRLTRVMEVILLKDGLTKQLRAPAISRLQKIHNVELGLKALSEADFNIMGDITSKDIVDGHREKTLSLLWQIIYKFRAPRFNAAATSIQLWWRQIYLKVVINRRIREKIEVQRNTSAITIQKVIRGWLSRRKSKIYREQRIIAATLIQKNIKTMLAVKRYRSIKNCIVIIQRWYRNVIFTKEYRNDFILVRTSTIKIQQWYRRHSLARKLELAAPIIKQLKEQNKLQHKSANILQQFFKSFILRKKFRIIVTEIVIHQRKQNLRKNSAIKILAYYRAWKARTNYIKLRNSVIVIQRLWRQYSLTQETRNGYLTIKKSTILIQNYYRNYLITKEIRKNYIILRKTIIFIQQKFKANYQMKIEHTIYLQLQKATTLIQRKYRANRDMIESRELYLRLKNSAIVLQRRFRAQILMKKCRVKFLLLRNTAEFIQILYRSTVIMKKQRTEYLRLKSATIYIQQTYRRKLHMKKERDYYLKLQASALCIQRRFRANQRMISDRERYLIVKRSVTVIQEHYRAYRAMQIERTYYLRLRNSVLLLQRLLRAKSEMKQCHMEFIEIKQSTIKIQKYFRNYLIMKKCRTEFLALKKSTEFVQHRFRANQAMKFDRESFLKLKSATISFQRQFRAQILMKNQRNKYLQLRNRTICIQQNYRATKKMKENRDNYLKLQKYVIIVQQRFRAQLKMKEEREKYILLQKSVLMIQQKFRANKLMELEHKRFLKMKASALKIQQYVRGYQMMKRDRSNYLVKKNAAIVIQTHVRRMFAQRNFIKRKNSGITIQRFFRGYMLMRKQSIELCDLKRSAIVLQRQFRALKMMQKQRAEYLMKRRAVIKIQSHVRKLIEIRNYIKIRNSTITIQQYVRASLLMKKQFSVYKELRNNTIIVQRRFRAQQIMKKERLSYLNKKNAAIKIQSHVRKLIEMKRYTKMRECSIKIQRRLRAQILMKNQKNEYNNLRSSTITIQRQYRAQKLMKIERIRYLLQQSAAIKIQTIYRKFSVRSKYLQIQRSIITIQRRFRANIMMKNEKLNYLRICHSIILIQQRFRAQLLMKTERKIFINKRNAAITLQSHYRAIKERKSYNTLKNSVIYIQSRFRANLEMKKQYLRYTTIKRTVILIQHKFRAQQLMKVERNNYLNLRKSTITIQSYFRGLRERRNYQNLRNATTIIQRRFRAYQEMKTQVIIYKQISQSILFIQQRFRANQLMHRDMTNYQIKRNAVIKIQSVYRGYIQRKCYLNIRESTKLIQKHVRSTILMRKQLLCYTEMKKSVIIIQRKFRAYQIMKSIRNDFLVLRKAAITIQQRYRAQRKMKIIRNQYLLIKSVVIYIQRKYRANCLMFKAREKYLMIRKSIIHIQQIYRGKILMRYEHQRYLRLKESTINLQAICRGYISRIEYQKLIKIKLTPEVLELRQKQKACKKIQACWRGHRVRKRTTPKMAQIRANIKQLRKVQDITSTIRYKLEGWVKFLYHRYNVIEATHFLKKLDNLSRVVPHLLVFYSEDLAKFCCNIMAMSIRSEPDKLVIELCSKIILNLSRYVETKDTAFQPSGLITISTMLLRWCDKDCPIFNTLCTLIWVFAHDPRKKRIIRDFMINQQSIFMLRETNKLIIRKKNMKTKDKRPNIGIYYNDKKELPNTQPDFGVVKTSPYIFNCSVYGFANMMEKLQISI